MENKNQKTRNSVNQFPLVSVLVFNYNYGRFLQECIDSILAQTYPNIEICFSDNCSTDDSWNTMLEYQKKCPNVFSIAKNRINFGVHNNVINCTFSRLGKYHLLMCSDDAMEPQFIEKVVRALESNPHCGFAMVNRSIIDEEHQLHNEPPFYNRSCIIPGAGQAAVYMLAAVNPSVSQVVYVTSRTAAHGSTVAQQISGRWYGTRLLDFNLCCNYDLAYINEPLLRHRLHGENDSLQAAGNLIEIIGPLLLAHQFAETAKTYGLEAVSARLPDAIEKYSALCLRYCTRFLLEQNEKVGEQYFYLAIALSLSIKKNPLYKTIERYWNGSPKIKNQILELLQNEANLISRKISYDPPVGSTELHL